MAAEGLPIDKSCDLLGVSVSGFYSWLTRPPSARSIRHAWLTDIIRQVHAESRETYGSKRVHAELTIGRGIPVGREAVTMLMHRAGIRGLSGRPKYRRIANVATASDLVDRQFDRSAPDRLWVTDITEHPTREGKVYCAAVLDAFSRRVVGWSIDSRPTAALVTNALGMAIDQRQPDPKMTVIHSDQGTQAELNWSLQHPDLEGGWTLCMHIKDKRQSGRCGARCSLPAVHRSLGEETAWPSGTRSLRARRPMMPPRLRGCHHRSAIGGSGTLEE